MTDQDEHYRRTVEAGRGTRLARCGYADRFDPFRLGRLPRVRALYAGLFSEFLGEEPFGALLDIGCGTGIYFEALAGHGREIHTLDASEAMVGVARNFCESNGLNHVYPIVGAAEALPYQDNRFDAAVALDTLHHVSEVEPVLEEVFRVLKPGGVFLVFEPNILNPLMWVAHALPAEERRALCRNRPATLRALLEKHFHTVRWQGICALITETEGVKRRLLDTYISFCAWTGRENLYPRQAWLGVKPEAQ